MGRFDLARQRRGLTKRDLAHRLDVTDRTVSNWYNNQEIDERILEKAAEILDFPLSFFYGSDVEKIHAESVSFRALTKMTAKKRDMAISQTILAEMISDWIDQNFELPLPNVPDLHELRSDFSNAITNESIDEATDNEVNYYLEYSYPEACADTVRKAWGLGEQPIPNLIALLESKGIRVFSLTDEAQDVDACCRWTSGRPFIFLNTSRTAERCRFDLAHELGHLVMHKHGIIEGIHIEQEANAFASAFLMPRRSLLADPLKIPSLRSILSKKEIWQVSAAALTYRYNKLGIITDWNATSIYKQLAQRGRNNEPNPIAHESSLLLDKVFKVLAQENFDLSKLTNDLCLTLEEISNLTFNLVSKYQNLEALRRRSQLTVLE
ncbi:helix-turn-helix domain-containing protein [Acinetobacter baumannii]|uniref:helix-turn-helix domain-containing protein n=3 Tax=Acinetobacter TaxID=469 RepID=UPI001D172548|nr:XRE family transcriptional regulator [Acinetobacter baumannii]MDC4454244.1 XRE family transcriptional regulator [Acinetobacter baumannii]MDH2621706.1 XRE family transcriptional regulator [Acinetobacter baumannii]MDO7448837.1 XRE family transcriptional regulator [Acinetobacter baumannii]MDV7382229.1 XRE family transcriptional regulator [Acinetobacter baumannii]MDV7611900.1 XRE family transcriptional regulator [Acinetobacter baumannii]